MQGIEVYDRVPTKGLGEEVFDGLNETYNDNKTHILMIKLFTSLNEVYSIVQQE